MILHNFISEHQGYEDVFDNNPVIQEDDFDSPITSTTSTSRATTQWRDKIANDMWLDYVISHQNG
jgi:hypothetical protein